ncbi:monovalent cation/H+ antiporter complex subunit F [Verrucosispora sp. WMMD573]|uniref:monovalent cation/H+ antiporter complex subunit F n=1 Tax=Verrucosispora sp. WMMD573 TaxID=3015149 RepID=UPI00248B604D|nr:monovalent cation/H+ antiporter complex subunit F [Verrucosispora sp. WMMD573]WBB53025.1 monovalent cation/H+ antiporter complex subunit F [Verrucosispora sp. WMMD573]
MTAVAVTVTVLLAVAGGLTLTRVIRGPSILDRAVATDVLLAIIVAAIATEAAYSRDATALPVLVVLAVLGFVGSVSVARFAARRDDSSTSTPSDRSRT